ncbi:hypothetical protein FISHEDRAFT_52611 [Fistulina hepatica ATCC 64428]|nr:hypothetical protein FISHEDRAFT_52611 [Fistulina hepatica ATCC 64428]
MSNPKIISSTELPTSEAKWITLKKLKYLDQEGHEACMHLKRRNAMSSYAFPAVSIFAIIRSPKNAFPPSTVVIEQYRPPMNKFIIGLIDESETPEQAAIRELEEETGLRASGVLESSPVVCADPGMTTANMKLVTLAVELDDPHDLPDAKPDPGEFIAKRIVEISKLADELREYDKKGFMVDARLFHLAIGLEFSQKLYGSA